MSRGILGGRTRVACVVVLAACAAASAPAGAQYFGRNKVQYETFDFRVLHEPHFDIHYYPVESLATVDAARMAERWYARHSRTLNQTFDKKPLVFYANHPDFQQTNVIGGFIEQGTGGVTEAGRSRVVMPFTGIYAENDHVLGHEMVHVFQFHIAALTPGGGINNMNRLPLWLSEGMAEYLSVGRDDPHTAMWLRDAALRNDLPTIKKLSTDPRYFPYRFGQALWAYIGGRWGDQAVNMVFRNALRTGFEGALRRVLGVSSDTLSAQWLADIRATYNPLMTGRQKPGEVGQRLLPRTSRRGDMDLAPALSPDGRYVAFLTRRGLFSIDLYVADAQTGEIIKQLTGPNTDEHFDALSFINSAGSWSPDGRKLAFVVVEEGDNAIAIFDVNSRRVERRIRVPAATEIDDPSWGPNDRLVFSGSRGGTSDLYVLDLATGRTEQLTNDRYADLQPTWSPDGRSIAFASDRVPQTDFEKLQYGRMRLALYDMTTRQIRLLPGFEGAKHLNPQFSPDGRDLFFISDRGGFSDIYRLALGADSTATGITQVTRLATGVSGITEHSPALTVARQTGRLVFSVFENAGNTLYRLEADAARGLPVEPLAAGSEIAGVLPPVRPRDDVVSAYLADPLSGLPPRNAYTLSAYRPSLQLDYLGTSGVGLGVGGGRAGLVGGVQGFFGDLLSDHVLGATVLAQGQLRDVGGEIFYLNQRHRWNWNVGASHVPYLTGYVSVQDTAVSVPGGQIPLQSVNYQLIRIYIDQGSVGTQYPLSQTRRVELNANVSHIGYGSQNIRYLVDFAGNVLDQATNSGSAANLPSGFWYYQPSVAYVTDYSNFGFTSPVAGARYRLEFTPTFGQLRFQQVLADLRRYLFVRPVTLAGRALHFGRYGSGSEDQRLSPLFVGQEYFIRGYDPGSFTGAECTTTRGTARQTNPTRTGCPEFDRLIGSRIAVANLELRIPLFGTEELGLINFPAIPTEISPFVDMGLAWGRSDSPQLRISRNTADRVPVFSAGVSARFNVFGYAVVEAYYAYPFQRPVKGAHFGFQLAPGW